MAKKKFYAVKKGIKPGVYLSWSETEVQVKGFPGAKFKGFATKTDAQNWLENETSSQPGKYLPKASGVQVMPEVQHGEVIVYTDGGALNNPGPGGYGVVLLTPEGKKELSGGFQFTTNNRMELFACIVALRELKGDSSKIQLYSDSSYVVNGMSKGWVRKWHSNGWLKSDRKPVLNQDLWAELLSLSECMNIEFNWVKGHAGNPLNDRCDKLAVTAARGKNLQIDSGYGND